MDTGLGLSVLPKEKQDALVSVAREFVHSKVGYSFSGDEQKTLKPFFTNIDQRVFFMHSLPSNVMATLASMFSRLKNKRGIRGVFVDSFLPGLLVSNLCTSQDDVEPFLKNHEIKNLRDFISYSSETRSKFEWFVSQAPEEAYTRLLADSQKAKKFLGMWLDQYGHNSIARMGEVWICFEDVSILAAKSIEWTRPGAGYVELSTRFVDREKAGVYPIDNELRVLGTSASVIQNHLNSLFILYADNLGDNLNGLFPNFLREKWGKLIEENGGKVEVGVAGETFDILGNLLPAATLTSVAAAISGESLPSVLRHLILDDTAENLALVELILQEAGKVGADQFIRHYQPSDAEIRGWKHIPLTLFGGLERIVPFITVPKNEIAKNIIEEAFFFREEDEHLSILDIRDIVGELFIGGRDDHDKLPREFELVTVPFVGVMSFRGWRDLHRQGLSTHRRTLLTPSLGFYRYDKPQPPKLAKSFQIAKQSSQNVYVGLNQVPPVISQYILPIGFRAGFIYSANLRQHEFCNWQRTKPSVNHEVRQIFLSIEKGLRDLYPWWHLFSRANMTPAYIFARGSEVPLTQSL
ncbi:MAG: hypothetical protein A2651_02525 [Candidatus Yanofskybacteria bacterium RIFCSPHIGHO2_01_FULL_42_12]|uniref:Uncharacterized protein n=1 Tax=Candidatus Yanofskybacteria bacterium RIFCSPLOWO2_01_FULL_42_49 TaxID=1802694 RepID=A0A1F8GB80_9BACT|nr:MAG: hypothetical protein A2651_02525 [Candidatus Yanofskybacteria bacterium RIFCSPHIGHO2_01_FULL_42_12]OGN22541.1 MAG: hypothetical protein A2918_02150 [Candidatus Yanofskybacteria bacterium RIFCSPLOWO2_01_FULL_42_49]